MNAHMATIDAVAVWRGEARECARFAHQFATIFQSNVDGIASYYGWKKAAVISALQSAGVAVSA